MKKIYDNMLLQGWMFDPLELMNKEERKDYINSLVESALAGKVITDNPQWKRLIAKALSSIKETKAKYYEKSKKNGMKGKEYGIQGKEYGIQGKEYGKLGGRPRKRADDFNAIYTYIASSEENKKQALSDDKEPVKVLKRKIKGRFSQVAEDNDENNKLINGVIKKIKEENAKEKKPDGLCDIITSDKGLASFIAECNNDEYDELKSEYINKGYTDTEVDEAFNSIRRKYA